MSIASIQCTLRRRATDLAYDAAKDSATAADNTSTLYKLIKGARLHIVKDGPHAVTWTHVDEVNSELVNFLGKSVGKQAASAQQTKAVA